MRVITRARALAAVLAVVLVAGACGGSGDDPLETSAVTDPPAPAAEPDPPPEPPPPEPEPPSEEPVPEPPPPEPAPEPPAEEPVPAPPEPEPAPEPPVPEPPEPEPAPEEPAPEPPESPEDLLDAEAVTALVARLEDARSNLTSSHSLLYVSMRLDPPGEPGFAVDDVPLGTVTQVGDRTYTEIDMAGMLAGIVGTVNADEAAELESIPPIELIADGETKIYMRLAMLAAIDPAGQAPWLGDLAAEHGDGVGELWGFVDLSGLAAREVLSAFGLNVSFALQDDFLVSLAEGSTEGVLLQARRGGLTEVAGVETQEYSFVLDLMAMSNLPDFIGSLLGDLTGGADSPPGALLGGLRVPVEFTVHVDGEDNIRRLVFGFDMGALLSALFSGLAESGQIPDGAEEEVFDLEYFISSRLDTIVVNDPSLVVELPDPSLVVELPELAIFAGLL